MNGSDPAATLEWTGERLVTTCRRPLVFEHLHRYAVACALAAGKRVLDIACGEGYGANLLARTASKVTGVDLDPGTIAHAQAKYRHPNLEFIAGDCTEIPCADRSVDLVASFETIEHIENHERFLAEIKRVLVPGGVVVISSPDRAEYRAVSGGRNPFHLRELSHEEFTRLMQKTFVHCIAGRQRLVAGSWIGADAPSATVATGTFHGGFNGIRMLPGVDRGVYSIAVCSDTEVPILSLGLFEDYDLSAEVWNLLDSDETPVEVEVRIREATHLKTEFEGNSRHVALLRRALEKKSHQIAHFKGEGERQSRALDRLHLEAQLAEEKLARVSHELAETRWDLLTFRGNARGGNYSGALEAQNRAQIAEGERDCLRGMVHRLQTELEDARAALEGTTNQLRDLRERVQRLHQSFAQKLMLPFSSSQRKLRRLTKLQTGG